MMHFYLVIISFLLYRDSFNFVMVLLHISFTKKLSIVKLLQRIVCWCIGFG